VDGAPYAQEYGGGQNVQGSSDRHRRGLHERRTKSMVKTALCVGIRPNLLAGLQGGLWISQSRSPSGNPIYSLGFISLSHPPPFLFNGGGTTPATTGLFCLDGLQSTGPRIYQEEHQGRAYPSITQLGGAYWEETRV
jgi:hypothetical protein